MASLISRIAKRNASHLTSDNDSKRQRKNSTLEKPDSTFESVLSREFRTTKHPKRIFSYKLDEERYIHQQLSVSHDTHDPSSSKLQLSFLKKRSKIIEITCQENVLFALTQNGVCAAYDQDSGKRLCFLNVSPDEVIRSLFYNKCNSCIITVSVHRSDNFSMLQCRNTPIQYIVRGTPEDGFPLFESETLRWPGFVEFDDVNQKVLTCSAKNKTYKVWDIVNYKFLFQLCDPNIMEVKMSPGVLLIMYRRTASHIPLKLISLENAEVIKQFTHLLHRGKRIEFVELFSEKILVKQNTEPLQIVDLETMKISEVADFVTPSAFIFLHETQLFLSFNNGKVVVWNIKGELVTKFADHKLYTETPKTTGVFITEKQDVMMSFCWDTNNKGAVNVSHILTGKLIAKMACQNTCDDDEYSNSEVTSLCFNEDRNELITGNANGLVHIWR